MKAVVVVSDLHCGSVFGLLPPDVEMSDGRTTSLTEGQRWLWERWLEFGKALRQYDVAALVVNGDVVDGRQRAQHGSELSLPVLQDQAAAAKVALAMLMREGRLDHAEVYGVQGTEYHDGIVGVEADSVFEAFGAKRYKGTGLGRWSREVLDLKFGRWMINFTHHIGIGAGAVERELRLADMHGADADMLVRSHVHHFAMAASARRQVVVTPCWQLQTRFMRKRGLYGMRPDIGGIVIVDDGQLVVHKYIYG